MSGDKMDQNEVYKAPDAELNSDNASLHRCSNCQEMLEGNPKKTTLGFLKIKCQSCKTTKLSPLSKYYLAAYIIGLLISIFVFLNSPQPLDKMGGILIMFGLCLFVLVRNIFIVKSNR